MKIEVKMGDNYPTPTTLETVPVATPEEINAGFSSRPAPGSAPQPGEVWTHERYGRVRIMGNWNAKESVVQTMDGSGTRHIAMNCFMRKWEAEEPNQLLCETPQSNPKP